MRRLGRALEVAGKIMQNGLPPARCRCCGYYEDGVHEPVDQCDLCREKPERRADHHAFVSAGLLDRIRRVY